MIVFKEIKTFPFVLIILLKICAKGFGETLPQYSPKEISPKDQVMIIDHPVGFNIFTKSNNSKIERIKRSNCGYNRCSNDCVNVFEDDKLTTRCVFKTKTTPRSTRVKTARSTRKPPVRAIIENSHNKSLNEITTSNTAPATQRSTTQGLKRKTNDTSPKHIKITAIIVKPTNEGYKTKTRYVIIKPSNKKTSPHESTKSISIFNSQGFKHKTIDTSPKHIKITATPTPNGWIIPTSNSNPVYSILDSMARTRTSNFKQIPLKTTPPTTTTTPATLIKPTSNSNSVYNVQNYGHHFHNHYYKPTQNENQKDLNQNHHYGYTNGYPKPLYTNSVLQNTYSTYDHRTLVPRMPSNDYVSNCFNILGGMINSYFG